MRASDFDAQIRAAQAQIAGYRNEISETETKIQELKKLNRYLDRYLEQVGLKTDEAARRTSSFHDLLAAVQVVIRPLFFAGIAAAIKGPEFGVVRAHASRNRELAIQKQVQLEKRVAELTEQIAACQSRIGQLQASKQVFLEEEMKTQK